ncbi:hypothetical protein G6F43_008925 [Rhizopus delemar]|nr:hypothetical protein G6F43_008925 [Rhizopus delemar]
MSSNKQQKEVEMFLSQCGLLQYFDVFIEEGFERIESLLEITEIDLIQMQLLQRAVANAKGIPPNVPLNIEPTSVNYSLSNSNNDMNNNPTSDPITTTTCTSPSIQNSPITSTLQPYSQIVEYNHPYPSAGTMSAQSGMSSTEEEAVTSDNVHRLWKRKYHRHPKPDTNAPVKPPSAYVMFSNDIRAELKQQNRSFTDLAKIIGDRWKSISAEEKELYETKALKAREKYLKEIEEYQKTDSYKRYQQYLFDFKAENEAAARPVGRPRKKQTNNKSALDDNAIQPPRQYPFYLLNADNNNNNSNHQNSEHNNTSSTCK